MNESTGSSGMQTYLPQATTRQLLDWRRTILERDKPFPLPPDEEHIVELIGAEILGRTESPAPQAVGTSPHTPAQLTAIAIGIIALVFWVELIPDLDWFHAAFAALVCAWLMWHRKYLFPQRHPAR